MHIQGNLFLPVVVLLFAILLMVICLLVFMHRKKMNRVLGCSRQYKEAYESVTRTLDETVKSFAEEQAAADDTINGLRADIAAITQQTDGLTEATAAAAAMAEQLAASEQLLQENKKNHRADIAELRLVIDSLSLVAAEAGEAIGSIIAGASQISGDSKSLAEGAAQQDAAVEELRGAVADIYEKAGKASENAASATQNTMMSLVYATHGIEAVKSMQEIMDRVKSSGSSISRIINLIADIAAQTNILALNASIEAAHAGKHGRGFSIVAEEVRSLAGKSKKSADDSKAIIEENTENITEGVGAAESVNGVLEIITNNINEITDLVSSIAVIFSAQGEAIDKINGYTDSIALAGQDIMAIAAKSDATSRELVAQAEQLKEKLQFSAFMNKEE